MDTVRRLFAIDESKIVDVVAVEPPSLNIDAGFLDVPPHHPCPQLFVGYQVLWKGRRG